MEPAILIDQAQVARPEPSIRRKCLLCHFGKAVIAGEHPGTAREHFAKGAGFAVGLFDTKLDIRDRSTGSIKPGRTGRVDGEHRRSFGQPVTRPYLPTERLQRPSRLRFECRAA